ncbi:MAG: hypothetical protein HQ510_00960 [Candidatus Marinimicrobia bacterium]|nr:hypothetical protein [Candidatus Neomarinimicrobiota bacterium]
MTEVNQDIPKQEKKKYDGSRRPMLLVKSYKSSSAVKNAKNRLKLRFEWIKKRNEEIKRDYGNSQTDALTKRDLLQENKSLSKEITDLMAGQKELTVKYEELEKLAREEVKNATLEPLNLENLD